jgi:4-alpha-glucanotransferase
MKRKSGILLAVTSLPSPHGVGDFGPAAYKFIDLLAKHKQKMWQILPLNPMGYGNSPYQPYGSKPFDELYISLELLQKDKLLPKRIRKFQPKSVRVDFQKVRTFKEGYLRKAYAKFLKEKRRGFKAWFKRNKWVYNYALFLTLKKENQLNSWLYWPEEHKNVLNGNVDLSPFKDEINFTMWLQFIAFKQWNKLHRYAKKNNIDIVGDIPIYVGVDSIDVFENREVFLLDGRSFPTHIAGVPPDYFSKTGQRWGNPLYDWDHLVNTKFAFWKDRLGFNAELFDYIRIDHFRAFDTYYKIPEWAPTAETGEWVEAPGYAFFDEILATFPHLKIIAEDLGDLRPEVLKLRDHYNFPGMEIVQFTYQGSKTKPEKYHTTNRIIYPGTHDNQTTYGWFGALEKEEQRDIVSDLARRGFNYDSVIDQLLAYTFASDADIAIIPMQDVLSLDDRARFNVPGTIGSPNWEWKLKDFKETKLRLPFIELLTKKYNR